MNDDIVELFRDGFGPCEGPQVADLAHRLMTEMQADELRIAQVENDAAALLTRMRYPTDPRSVWLLSPVAVRSRSQRCGIGTAMLKRALEDLRADGADLVLTYGDPAFYGRLGFVPVTQKAVPAPFRLSQPHGWQAVWMSEPCDFSGRPEVAAAFDDPVLW